MSWTILIYVGMAVLCLYSLAGLHGHGLLAMMRAGKELENQARRLADWDTAQAARKIILGENFGDDEAPIPFHSKALREAMANYCTDVKKMSLVKESKYQCDIEDYINMSLLENVGNSSFVEHACGGLTGLGILGTFIGMTNGLSGFNTQDAENALQSIALLTRGMDFAFVTSIWGIILSLALGTLHRIVRHGAEQKLERFLEVFRNNVLSNQQEAGYNQLLNYLSNIVLRLESKADNEMERMSFFARQFIADIREQLEFDIDGMRKSMELVNAQQQIFAGSVKEFGQQIDRMGKGIEAVSAGVVQIVNQTEMLTRNLEQAGNTISAGIGQMREMVEADSEIVENNRVMSEQLRERTEELASLVGSVNTQALNTADVVRKLADYTASAVDETAAGCNKLVEKHYDDLKNRMKALMDVAEAQNVHIRKEGATQLEQLQKHADAAVYSVSEKAREVVLEMPQTQILREELDNIIETQNIMVRQLSKRNSLLVKLWQNLRRETE